MKENETEHFWLIDPCERKNIYYVVRPPDSFEGKDTATFLSSSFILFCVFYLDYWYDRNFENGGKAERPISKHIYCSYSSTCDGSTQC